MKRPIALLGILSALVAAFSLTSFSAFSTQAAAQATAPTYRLRFVHALAGARPVDITVDGTPAARNLAYGSATRFLNVKLGDHTLIVEATGSSSPLLTAKVSLSPDKPSLIVVIQGTPGGSAPQAGIYDEDLGPLAAGNTRLTAINAIADSSAVDVLRGDGSPLIKGLKFGDVYGGFDIPAMLSDVLVVPTGGDASSALITANAVTLDAGTHNTLIALGSVKGGVKPSYLVLTAATAPNAATDVLVRFVNAATDTKTVDVYANGKLIAPGLIFASATEHIALPNGATKIELRNAGDSATAAAVGQADLTFDSTKIKAQTVVISQDTSNQYAVQPYTDNVATLDPSKARVNVIDAAGGSADVSLNSSTTITATAGKSTTNSDVAAGAYAVSASVNGQTATANLTLNGGTLTDLVVVSNGSTAQIVAATTGLSEQPGSLPGASGAVAASTAAAPTNAAVAAAPTIVSTPQPAAPTATLAQVSVAPTATLVPVQPSPTATVVPGIVGVVNTNPGVNLKLRQHPNTTSLVLALLPSQATLTILGVRGPASATGTPGTPGQPGTRTATATIVANARAEIWLYVVWQTGDGGTATGWANAQNIDVTINGKPVPSNDTVRLLALKQIPEDTVGSLQNTTVTVAADSNKLIGTVATTNGSNAQLRRTPNIQGESLALVPGGATVIVISQTNVPITPVVGAPKSTVWFFVEYDTTDGSVFGWMSGDYLTLSRNKKPVDVSQVPVATEIVRGYTQGAAGATVVASPPPGTIATVVNLNNGANLQLRNTPDVNAQSLALIPLGTTLQVVGRTGSGAWLQVTFQGATGWVNVEFVSLTKNGKVIPVGDVAITDGKPNTFGTPTVTPTPTGAG